ncbi:MAG: hypothetical protein IPK79_11125 [Vampirovibrionales bacterium]|nr:hypothetical protein [Vampirovibrionales bacterium]
MTTSGFFQNAEYIIPFDKITHVAKFPPDRIEVGLVDGESVIILGEDCKTLLQHYLAYLQRQAQRLAAKTPLPPAAAAATPASPFGAAS